MLVRVMPTLTSAVRRLVDLLFPLELQPEWLFPGPAAPGLFPVFETARENRINIK